ncbi:MAG: hypothetical protein ABI806_00275 [Candidatus Solibacter sp.]
MAAAIARVGVLAVAVFAASGLSVFGQGKGSAVPNYEPSTEATFKGTVDQKRNLTDQEAGSWNISVLTTHLRSLECALRAIQEGGFGRCISSDSENSQEASGSDPPIDVLCQVPGNC